ncbi:MAG: glutathione S-transferase N-terminal domain-containing protein [Pseudomonadota bacterium]
MKLHYSAASPFVRKVMITAIETGLDARIEKVPTAVMPLQPNAELAKANPLMKVPTLVTDGGEALYDSGVICEYLDSLHAGPKLVPPAGPERWRVLRVQALADGIADAGILCRYEETARPADRRSKEWVEGQLKKVVQGLDILEGEQALAGAADLGQIAVAAAIGWLEFRNVAGDIRAGRPRLFRWYEAFAKRASMMETVPRA